MQSLWNNSPATFADFGVYYAGGNRCDTVQANLTTTWTYYVGGTDPVNYPMFWNLMLLNVSWQPPYPACTSMWNPYQLSSNLTTDATYGRSAADDGAQKAIALGISANAPLYLDVEPYNPNNTYQGVSCASIINALVKAYLDELQVKGFRGALYVNSCSSRMSDFARFANPPADVWLASWDGRATTWGIPCVADGWWTQDQRIHQYAGNQSPSWSPVTIDYDCENGDVAGQFRDEPTDGESPQNPPAEDPTC